MRNRLFQSIIDAIKTEIGFKKYCIPYNVPKNTYKKLVCITGFGHSGSGAVLDYLSEFENVTVFGFHDDNGSGYTKKAKKQIAKSILYAASAVFLILKKLLTMAVIFMMIIQ